MSSAAAIEADVEIGEMEDVTAMRRSNDIPEDCAERLHERSASQAILACAAVAREDLSMQNENEQNMAEQPAIVRLGHYAIELGRAAEEHGATRLIEMVRQVMIEVGREIARDVVRRDDQPQ